MNGKLHEENWSWQNLRKYPGLAWSDGGKSSHNSTGLNPEPSNKRLLM